MCTFVTGPSATFAEPIRLAVPLAVIAPVVRLPEVTLPVMLARPVVTKLAPVTLPEAVIAAPEVIAPAAVTIPVDKLPDVTLPENVPVVPVNTLPVTFEAALPICAAVTLAAVTFVVTTTLPVDTVAEVLSNVKLVLPASVPASLN